jgi:hypothetical protein
LPARIKPPKTGIRQFCETYLPTFTRVVDRMKGRV